MKKILVLVGLSFVLMLAACNKDDEQSTGQGSVNDGEAANEYGTIDHGVEDKKVGFNLSEGTVEEATGIPEAEKEQIMEAFNAYIDVFNEKDIDGYMELISANSESFDKTEERSYMADVFETSDLNRQATDVTIVKYEDNEAHVFANMKTWLKQLDTGLETSPSGRQVTVFKKEEGGWKVDSVHYLRDEEKK